MKKIIVTLILVANVSLAMAQAHVKTVPAPVKATFEKLYPDAKDVSWLKIHTEYKAEFTQGKAKASATIDGEGTLLHSEKAIAVNELPQGVKDYVSVHFPSTDISAASMIQDEKGKLMYEATAMGIPMMFDNKGKFLH